MSTETEELISLEQMFESLHSDKLNKYKNLHSIYMMKIRLYNSNHFTLDCHKIYPIKKNNAIEVIQNRT